MQATAGKLLYYYKDPYCKVPIFISGEAKRCVLWIGGQQESFFTICYFQELAEKLGGSWAFAQTEIPSGHIAYGAQDHRSDTEDIDDILLLLKKEYGMEEIALFATSTGVQVALQLLATGNNTDIVTRVILHGIVCRLDNPFFTEVAIAKRNERVKQMMADGRREDSRSMIGFYDIPVTPARLCEGGFLTMQEALWLPALNNDAATAKEALKAIKVPCFIMIATDSQYKPSKDDVEKVRACATEAVGCPAADVQVEVFNDTCDEVRRLLKADIPAHVAAITKFLKKEDEKRAVKEAEEQALREEEEKRKRIALSKLM